MKQIQSRSNPFFKALVSQSKLAGRLGEAVWLEGPHLCEAWLSYRGQPTWLIFADSHASREDVAQLRKSVNEDRQVELQSSLFNAISSVSTHQGVLFVVEPALPSKALSLDQSMVMLDRVQDPGNLGTILRLSAAAGIRQVVTSPGSAACWSQKVLRSAQGAHFCVQIHEGQDLSAVLDKQRLESPRIPILATALADAVPLFTVQLPENAIWLFGSEGQGLSESLLKRADTTLRIDHDRQAVESLNVASAVAICLFEQRRQVQQRNPAQ
jgi:RNA methyltransferase, TrmH family